jgi:uncharacterized protein YdaU (DUF1376 family)
VSRRPTIEIWMPLHFAEINKATARMTPLEECAFLRLLRDYWLNGSPPNDNAVLANIVRYSAADWRKVRPAVAKQFVIRGKKWVHEATESRREHASKVSQNKRRTPESGCANAYANDPANAAIRDISSNSSTSVDNHPSDRLAEELEAKGSVAPVIPLAARAGR